MPDRRRGGSSDHQDEQVAESGRNKRSFSESQGGSDSITPESPRSQTLAKRAKTGPSPSSPHMNDASDLESDHSSDEVHAASEEDDLHLATESRAIPQSAVTAPYYSQGSARTVKPQHIGYASNILDPRVPLYTKTEPSSSGHATQPIPKPIFKAEFAELEFTRDLAATLQAQSFNLHLEYTSTTHIRVPDRKFPVNQGPHTGLDATRPPLSDYASIYRDMVQNMRGEGYFAPFEALKSRPLRLFTMCSGTEAPILSAQMLKAELDEQKIAGFDFHHVASCEIEPFKQAYIHRNFDVKTIYRDVTDFCKENMDARNPSTVYGAPELPPENIDLLIAGSSCVDYSLMNKSPKGFQIDGESWATMRGISDYANKYRPAMVILENVRPAPWDEIRKYWESLEYVSHVVLIDTKDYYIPQTRQRGYMLALDKNLADRFGFPFATQLPIYEKVFNKLARRATASFTSFLINPDDPRFQVVARDVAAPTPTRWRGDWIKCRIRMNKYRSQNGLGTEKPVTDWRADGSSRPLDYLANRAWVKSQVPRVKDFLDIVHLRGLASKEYDPFYKTRCIDLSQNIDRQPDNKPPGVVGCITPNGTMFNTLRGGPISGIEALNLQGIPVNELDLGTETSKQLTDLAGNAMSGTVIGTALIAAIVVAHWKHESEGWKSLLTCFGNDNAGREQYEDKSVEQTPPQYLPPEGIQLKMTETHMVETQVKLDRHKPFALLDEFKELASRSRQLCACELYSQVKSGGFFICDDCCHTVCAVCKGNPEHNYTQLFYHKRESPAAFVAFVQKNLPRSLKLNAQDLKSICCRLQPFKNDHEFRSDKAARLANGRGKGKQKRNIDTQKIKNANEEYQQRVLAAASATYHYNRVYRSRIWKIEFVSPFGRLELRISPKSDLPVISTDAALSSSAMECRWLLFANCDPEEPSGSELRDEFQEPIAVMDPGPDVLSGGWKAVIRDPSVTEEVQIVGTGDRVDSYESKLSIQTPAFEGRKEFSELQISGVTVKDEWTQFRLLPKCAGAQGSLHRCDERDSARTLYFFLDPGPMAAPYEDYYSISRDHHRRINDERREVIMKFPPGWRPNIVNGQLQPYKVACVRTVFEPLPKTKLSVNQDESTATIWIPRNATAWEINPSYCDGIPTPILCVKVPLPAKHGLRISPGQSLELDLANLRGKLHTMEWLLSKLDVPNFLGIMGDDWVNLEQPHGAKPECKCCPVMPRLSWKWSFSDGRCKTKVIMPVEDPIEAAKFEKAIQRRPSPATVTMHRDGAAVLLQIKINPQTLAHRAAAALRQSRSTRPLPSIYWRVVKYDVLEIPPLFEPISLQPEPIPEQSQNRRPARFREGRELWPSQCGLLEWAVDRESKPAVWVEMEQEDATISPLGWSVEVRATSSRMFKGGIIADEVGAGKTRSALALFACDRMEASSQLRSVRYDALNYRISSMATLILVPKGIVHQWAAQIEECFAPPLPDVITLKKVDDLMKYSLQDFIGAKIIITAHNLLDDVKYWERLRLLTVSPNIPVSGGRPFEQWLNGALETLAHLLEKYDPDDEDAIWGERENAKKNLDHVKAFAAYRSRKDHKKAFKGNQAPEAPHMKVSSKFTPQAFEDDEDSSLNDEYLQEIEAWAGWGKKIDVLLHAFHFRRLIVDEFTYLKDMSLRGTVALSASRRWLLSATPPTNTFGGINTMARLLGTKLSTDNITPQSLGFGNKTCSVVWDRSRTETFLNFNKVLSVSGLKARHAHAHHFTDHFVRRYQVDTTGIKEEEHFIVFRLSALEYATYFEWLQVAQGSQIGFGRASSPPELTIANSTGITARSEYIGKWLEVFANVSHALTCSNSAMRKENSRGHGVSGTGCESVLANLKDDVGVLLNKLLVMLREGFACDRQTAAGRASKARVGPGKTLSAWQEFIRSVTTGEDFGEPVMTRLLSSMLYHASLHPRRPEKEVKGKTPEEKMSTRVRDMTDEVLKLLVMVRIVRFFDVITKTSSAGSQLLCAKCHEKMIVSEMVVLVACGHAMCKECHKEWEDEDCPEARCDGLSPQNLRIECSRFMSPEAVPHSECGSRMELVNRAVQELLDGTDDCIIIFVQHDPMIEDLVSALAHAKIPHINATGDSADEDIQQFTTRTKDDPRVLVLKVDTANAAGWNLQMANHIMFAAPIVTDTAQEYQNIMTQAIGRSFRPLQQKTVHVYHFAAARTIEVNIMEQMRKGALVRPSFQDLVGTTITRGATGITQESSVMAVLETDPAVLDSLTDEVRLCGPSLDAMLGMAWAGGYSGEGGDGDDNEDG